jgi:hypothetical protein
LIRRLSDWRSSPVDLGCIPSQATFPRQSLVQLLQLPDGLRLGVGNAHPVCPPEALVVFVLDGKPDLGVGQASSSASGRHTIAPMLR